MKADRVSLFLVALSLFAAPLIGGYLSQDQPLPITGSSPILLAMMGAPEAPTWSHFLLALPLVLALIQALVSRKVEPLPNPKIATLCAVLSVLLLGSVAISSYKFTSLLAACEWLTYLVALFAVVAVSGRRFGPKLLVSAIVAGTVFCALRGILEFAEAGDPGWRIFAGWAHPNAAAAVLLTGFLSSLALIDTEDRLGTALSMIASVLITAALWLTQSKGALLALGVGIGTFAIASLFSSGSLRSRIVPIFLALALISGGIGLGTLSQKRIAARLQVKQDTQRVFNSGSSQDQSSGYRMNLWKGAIALTKQNPMGSGAGSYRFQSAKPGITPQTHLTHNSFLQMAVELGVLATGVTIALFALCFGELVRGTRRHVSRLRPGLVGAIVGLAAHSLVDSDLHVFGTGMLFFALLGVGLQVGTDGTTFEFLSSRIRAGIGALACLLAGVFGYCAWVDTMPSQIVGNPAESAELAKQMQSAAPFDYRGWYYGALTATNVAEAQSSLESAINYGPTPRAYRLLARTYEAAKNPAKASLALLSALRLDPNNLSTLSQLMELMQRQGLVEDAKSVADRLINVEDSPYFRVRALPELVPTETLEARLFLAGVEPNIKRKAELLQQAVSGFTSYLTLTVPRVKKSHEAGFDLPGASLEDAQKAMKMASEAATTLARLYRSIGLAEASERADSDAAAFASAF